MRLRRHRGPAGPAGVRGPRRGRLQRAAQARRRPALGGPLARISRARGRHLRRPGISPRQTRRGPGMRARSRGDRGGDVRREGGGHDGQGRARAVVLARGQRRQRIAERAPDAGGGQRTRRRGAAAVAARLPVVHDRPARVGLRLDRAKGRLVRAGEGAHGL